MLALVAAAFDDGRRGKRAVIKAVT